MVKYLAVKVQGQATTTSTLHPGGNALALPSSFLATKGGLHEDYLPSVGAIGGFLAAFYNPYQFSHTAAGMTLRINFQWPIAL